MFGRRGPGLVRGMAATAVVAGTAGAVRHRQDQRWANKEQEQYDQQMAAQAQMQQQMQPEEPAYMAELNQLANLRAQGIITQEEFDAKKKQLLGL
jgi:Short C-terminal domain